LIESKLPFEANMDLRLSMEFGRRDHFSQLRRIRSPRSFLSTS